MLNEMTDEQLGNAKRQLFRLLDIYPSVTPILEERLRNGTVDGRGYFFIFSGCGCIYGTATLAIYPESDGRERGDLAISLRERMGDSRNSDLERLAYGIRTKTNLENMSGAKTKNRVKLSEETTELLLDWIGEYKKERQRQLPTLKGA